MAGQYTLNVERDAGIYKTFTYSTGDPLVPVDLTGASVELNFYSKINGLEPTLQITTGITTDASGNIVLAIPNTALVTMTSKDMYFSLIVQLAGGERRRLLAGPAPVLTGGET